MKTSINTFFILLITTVLFACSTSDDNTNQTSPYQQYGTPFLNMPESEDAIIYQVNLRAFSQEGTLNGVRERLNSIKDLGVNVIYLMPIYPNGVLNSVGQLGSPYSVRDYKAVSEEYGTLEDLRALVQEAHALDMAVVLDWVANHTSWDNAWITEHPEWYLKDENGNITAPPGTGWNDVAQLDFSSTELRKAMIDAMSYWVYSANIDGFRCDYADGVPLNFWSEAVSKIRTIKNQELLMLAEGTRFNHYQAGFNYTFGFNYFSALEKVFSENKPATSLQDSNAIEYANNYNPLNRVVRYTSNHDVMVTEGNPINLFGGLQGSMATFVLTAYMKSIPMIYNGQEIGTNQQLQFFSKTPINWDAVNQPILDEYKKIIAFRKTSNALKSGELNGYSSNAVCVFTMEKENERVLVLSNLTNSTVNYIFPSALTSTSWKDAYTDLAYPLSSQIILAPFEYIVLKN